jgi:hypothetical protein
MIFIFNQSNMSSLSWSNTRITVLEYCQKKYFFTYYSDGLKHKYPEIWKTTKILRKLKSLDMWMGEMTHKILSRYLTDLKRQILNSGTAPDKEKIIHTITENMKRTFEFSAANDYTDFIDF